MSVLYLYGFAPHGASLPPEGLRGVDDAEVEIVDLDRFTAVVGRVSAEGYDGPGLEAHSSDVEWMAEQGLRHEQVVAWFVDHGTIVPSRLLTLFSGEDALRDMAREAGDRIAATIERLAGLREWDLRMEWDRAALGRHLGEVSGTVARLDRDIAAASPGKRYLLEKKRDEVTRTESHSIARRLAREVVDGVRDEVDDLVVLEPPADAPSLSLAAAFLVDREDEPAFRERMAGEAQRLEPLGLSIRLTGPWAPYRFLERDER